MLGSDTLISPPVSTFEAALKQDLESGELEEGSDDTDGELLDEKDIREELELHERYEAGELEEDMDDTDEELEDEGDIPEDVSMMTLHPGEAVLYVSAEESVEQASQRFLSYLLSWAMPLTLRGM